VRRRGQLTLVLFIILLLIILAQNGVLGNIFSGLSNVTPIYYGPTAAPFATGRPLSFSTLPPSSGVLPAPFGPTAYLPPVYAPTYPGSDQGAQQPQQPQSAGNPPPAGVVANGQCIVPNGWVPYTIQEGDTLAIIAGNYNLTVDQLSAANCLSNPDLIYAGQIIAVPGAR